MGFNKRFLKKEVIIERFRLEGYQGIIDYIGSAEVLFGLDSELQQILDLAYCDMCPTKKNVEINKIIYGIIQ